MNTFNLKNKARLRTRVQKNERALHFRNGDFYQMLNPGTHWIRSRLWSRKRDVVQVFNALGARLDHPLLSLIVNDASMKDALTVVDLADDERALVWRDGRLVEMLGNGLHAFWNVPHAPVVEVFNVATAPRLEHPKYRAIMRHPQVSAFLTVFNVEPWQDLLLLQGGKLVERLGEGCHLFWDHGAAWRQFLVDRRDQHLDISGQEIMTRDKVTLRVNVLATYCVEDAVRMVNSVPDVDQTLYREAQLAVRTSIGTRTLDELLADKDAVGHEVRDAMRERAATLGVAVQSAGLRDVILPGEMKSILNQVIEAEKQAQANLVRRREETAAARSQANTARLLADNPVLARMKELEAVQEIVRGAKVSFVIAGDDDIPGQLARLVARSEHET